MELSTKGIINGLVQRSLGINIKLVQGAVDTFGKFYFLFIFRGRHSLHDLFIEHLGNGRHDHHDRRAETLQIGNNILQLIIDADSGSGI